MTRKWNQALLALVVLASITSLIGAVVYSRNIKQEPSPKFHQPATVRDVPIVVSKIKDLQITGVSLLNQGAAAAAVAIDVTNNRDSAVMSLDFIWRHKGDSGGIAMDGLSEEGNPRVVIPPHTLQTFTWSLGEIPKGETLFLAAAIFADGKEEGDQRSLQGIRKRRSQYQLEKRAAQTKQGGQQ